MAGSLSDETAETSRLVVELFQAIQATRRHADAGPAFLLPSGAERDQGAPRLSAHGIRAAIHVHQHGQRTVGQLAAGLGVSFGWASRVVEELGAAGYLLRERDPRDRRVVLVRLAPGAAADVERAYRWRGDAVQRALGGLDGRQRAGVQSFLRGVIDELARVRGT